MKRVISLVLALFLTVSLSACGSSGRADEALVGKYLAVTGTSMGMTLSGADMSGFILELKSGGKVTMTIDGTSADGKWVNDDKTITLTIEKTDMVGKLDKDTITFESILKEMIGTSMDVKFAKEGTDAAKPENFLPEEERALLGDWVGASVVAKPKWSYFSGMVSFEGDVAGGASLYGDYKDGKFMITYSGDNYYKFTMEPAK